MSRADAPDFAVRIVGEDEAEEGGERVSCDDPGAGSGVVVSVSYDHPDAA